MVETLEKLLTGISQCRDMQADANISKMMELNASLVKHYSECSTEALKELERKYPALMRQVSVNLVKRQRVEKTNKAIAEREERRNELTRKIKSLRKNVPEHMRQKLNSAAPQS